MTARTKIMLFIGVSAVAAGCATAHALTAELETPPLRTTQLVSIDNGEAGEIASIAAHALGPELTIQTYGAGNTIVVTGTPDGAEDATALIRELDRATIVAETYRAEDQHVWMFALHHADAKEVARMARHLFDNRLTVVADERTNALVVTGPRDEVRRLEQLITLQDLVLD